MKQARLFETAPFFVFLAAILGWLGFYHHRTIGVLLSAWQTEEYSHGPLLVLIALLWGARVLQENASETPQPSASALGLVLLGSLLGLVGQFAANHWIENVSILLSLSGVVGFFLGGRNLKRLAAPLGLLFFAIPLPPTVAPSLTAQMQLLSSDLGVAGLQLLGVSVYQEGNVIDIGSHKLYVAEACSGLRYVFPLLGFGYLVAFHAFRSSFKRAVLILSALPIAILCNGFRIAATGLIADAFGLVFVEGPLHEIEGFIVFALCLLCFAGIYALLRRWPAGAAREKPAARLLPALSRPLWARAPRLSAKAVLGLVLVMLLSAGCYALSAQRFEPVPQRESFALFPRQLAEWKGSFDELSREERETLLLDDYLLANYKREGIPGAVNLFVAYYASQEQGRSIHSPEICLPGGGWEIVSSDLYAVKLSPTEEIKVTREIVRKEGVRMLVYYWFNQGGENAANNWLGKPLLLRNAFLHGRTDGSLIRVSTRIEGEQAAGADKILSAFARDLIPVLPRHIGSPE